MLFLYSLRLAKLALTAVALAVACPGQVVIHEWIASNQQGITDRDGRSSDWIELHNTGATKMNLAGFYLTKGMRIAGEYLGRMDNVAGKLVLTGAVGQEIAEARYEYDWVPKTDGEGYSIVAEKNRAEVSEKAAWRRSEVVHGTPGR